MILKQYRPATLDHQHFCKIKYPYLLWYSPPEDAGATGAEEAIGGVSVEALAVGPAALEVVEVSLIHVYGHRDKLLKHPIKVDLATEEDEAVVGVPREDGERREVGEEEDEEAREEVRKVEQKS